MKELDLSGFHGSENVYTHPFGFMYTEGVKYLCDNGLAWLVDVVVSYHRAEPFQVWTLKVKDSTGVVTMREDSDQPVLVKQKIEYTDCPQDITLWLCDGIILLPSEY